MDKNTDPQESPHMLSEFDKLSKKFLHRYLRRYNYLFSDSSPSVLIPKEGNGKGLGDGGKGRIVGEDDEVSDKDV